MKKLAAVLFATSLGACAWQDQDINSGSSSQEVAAIPQTSTAMSLLPPAQASQLRAAGVVDVELNEQQNPWLLRFAASAVPASAAVQQIAGLYNIAPTDLAWRSTDVDQLGLQHHRYAQVHHGLPVVGAQLVIHEDHAGDVATVVTTLAVGASATKPVIAGADVVELAQTNYRHLSNLRAEVGDLVYVVKDGVMYLAHTITVKGTRTSQPVVDRIYMDAITGEYISTYPQIHTARVRETFDAKNVEEKGTLALSENQTTGPDAVITKIHTNTGKAYDCFKQLFNRDSFNGQGATIVATGHFGVKYNNAFWTPDAQQLVFGDGDGQILGPLVDSDIATHELAHAITSSTSNMTYASESGALNEAMSDIGAMICQAKAAGGVTDATWLLAEDSWTPNKPGDAMRYAARPSQDGVSKDHVSKMPACTVPNDNNDWCQVHTNSGIANLAFKLLVTGGTHPSVTSAVQVPALGMERSAQIAFRAWTQHMTPSSTFAQTRAAFKQSAMELYPNEPGTIAAAELAWYSVGAGPAIGNLPSGIGDPNKAAEQPGDPTPDPSNPNDPSDPGNPNSSSQLIEGGCATSGSSSPTSAAWFMMAVLGLAGVRKRKSQTK